MTLLQNIDRFEQAAAAGVGQIDLRDVAGDHGFRIEAEARDEHLHLFRSRVLGLVENHERVVERASAHEGDGRDLDHVLFQISLDALWVEHVEQRVI